MKKPEQVSLTEAISLPKKNIFIIKANEGTLRSETFLINRGWNLSNTTDLKKALAILLTQSVQYIMISVDHPSPKAKRLPGIIAKTINVPVILFSENTNQNGVTALRASAHPYILYPPVSGPSIERIISKIEKDLAKSKEENDEAIRVGGSVEGADYKKTQGQKKMGLAEMVHLFEGEGQSDMLSASESQPQANMKKATEANGSWTPLSPYKHKSSETNPSNSEVLNHENYQKSMSTAAIQSDQKDSIYNGSGSNNFGYEDNASLEQILTDFDGKSRIDKHNLSSKTKMNDNRVTAFRSKTGENNSSIFVMGIEHALASSNITDASTKNFGLAKVSKCSRVQCFEVQSDEFSGYVVMAYGAKLLDQKDFTEVLKSHLIGYLEKNGFHIKIGQLLEIKLSEVSFEEWSMEEASFLRKSIHNDSEVAVSFFPMSYKHGPIELSAKSHMRKITLNEIRSELPLEFDMYLYFPINEKYVLFTGKDNLIGENRYSRLVEAGVTDIHLRKESEKDLSRYRVQNFLNDMILEFSAKTQKVG